MVLGINYANKVFKPAQRVNAISAKRYGVDKFIKYSPKDIDSEYQKSFLEHMKYERGNGYWYWKPYIVYDALKKVNDGDYVFYLDSGSVIIHSIKPLFDCMERDKVDVMSFCLTYPEKLYTKRDAFILMDADKPEYTDTPQIMSTFIIVKKTQKNMKIFEEFMAYIKDVRIVTDQPNTMGYDNYDGFIENRHDQTIWSLICKKHGIKPYRDPSQYGVDTSRFSDDVIARSSYPQLMESHRDRYLCSPVEIPAIRKWYDYLNVYLMSLLAIKELKVFIKKYILHWEQ